MHSCQCKCICSDAGLEVEVKDAPKGMIPPGTQMVKPKAEPQPNKVSSEVQAAKGTLNNWVYVGCRLTQ